MNKIHIEYGKSMYGGWYANFYIADTMKYTGEHGRTLKELCEKMEMSIAELKSVAIRWDHA